MRLIWIKSDYIDPPDTGGKLRTFNLLRELNKRCDVTYVSLTSERRKETMGKVSWASRIITFFQPEEKKSGVVFYLRLILRLFSLQPYIVQKYLSRQVKGVQEQQLESIANDKATKRNQTVLVCDFLEMAGNIVWSSPWPKILFQHNVESVIWRRYVDNETNLVKRLYFWFEYRRLARYERKTCNRFDLILAVSAKDQETFRSMGVTVPIKVIETGVDVAFFTPMPDVVPTPSRLLFLGSLDWMPNIDGLRWFVNDIFPLIKKRCPQVSLDIVGRRPTPFISSLQTNDESIRVIGDVPDVRPYVATANAFVVPLRVGSGTRLKIFEAMAMGRPVVSTTIGAEGLPIEHEEHVLLADSPRAFAEQVTALLNDPVKEKAVADNGYRLVNEHYSWDKVSQRLFEVCVNTTGEPV